MPRGRIKKKKNFKIVFCLEYLLKLVIFLAETGAYVHNPDWDLTPFQLFQLKKKQQVHSVQLYHQSLFIFVAKILTEKEDIQYKFLFF